jgi:hypothetical protein
MHSAKTDEEPSPVAPCAPAGGPPPILRLCLQDAAGPLMRPAKDVVQARAAGKVINDQNIGAYRQRSTDSVPLA